jgi:hypothetical protein
MVLPFAVLQCSAYSSETTFARYELPYWEQAEATVERVWIRSRTTDVDGDTNTTWGYRLTFDSVNGPEDVEGANDDGEVSGFQPGQQVTISYDPDQPSQLRFGDKASVESEAKSALPLVLAVVFGLVATAPFWAMRLIRPIMRRSRRGASPFPEALGNPAAAAGGNDAGSGLSAPAHQFTIRGKLKASAAEAWNAGGSGIGATSQEPVHPEAAGGNADYAQSGQGSPQPLPPTWSAPHHDQVAEPPPPWSPTTN